MPLRKRPSSRNPAMPRLALLALVAVLPLALTACRVEVTESHGGGGTDVADQEIALGPHTVTCGCVVDGVGKCGNYIEIDGAYLQIANGSDLGLDKMEWCGQGAQTAEASGSVTDGAFTASALTVGE